MVENRDSHRHSAGNLALHVYFFYEIDCLCNEIDTHLLQEAAHQRSAQGSSCAELDALTILVIFRWTLLLLLATSGPILFIAAEI